MIVTQVFLFQRANSREDKHKSDCLHESRGANFKHSSESFAGSTHATLRHKPPPRPKHHCGLLMLLFYVVKFLMMAS